MAADPQGPWIKTTLRLYGKRVKVWYKHVDALWYSKAGQRLLRVVVVHGRRIRRAEVSRLLHIALKETPPPSVEQVMTASQP